MVNMLGRSVSKCTRGRLLLSTVLILLLCIGGCETPKTPPKPALLDAIQVFATEKSNAEQWAAMLKGGKWGSQTQSTEYLQGVKLYIDAKSSFDGLIARLRSDLSAQGLAEQVESASKKSSSFGHYVYKLLNPQSSASLATASKPLIDAGIQIWKVYQESEQRERDNLRKELDRLTWLSFEKIGVEKSDTTKEKTGGMDKAETTKGKKEPAKGKKQ